MSLSSSMQVIENMKSRFHRYDIKFKLAKRNQKQQDLERMQS